MSRRLLAAGLITATCAVLGVAGAAADWFGGFQTQAEDVLQPGVDAVGDVVVVGIDRRSLDGTGDGWPWPRTRHAELIDALGRAGARLVLYDVLLADERPGDEALAAALGRTPTVLASALTLRIAGEGPPRVVDGVPPAGRLARAAAAVGHTNVSYTPGRAVIRALPFYALTDREVVQPSIVLAGLAELEGSGQVLERPSGVQVGGRLIPLQDGRLPINWAEGLRPPVAVSALDVLRGTVDPDRLAGRIVIVGATDPTLGDIHSVAVDRSGSTPGAFVLANALNTVLTRSYLREPPTAPQSVLVVAAAALAAALFVFVPLRFAALGAAVTAAAVVAFTTWRFHTAGELWNVVWPVLAVAGASVSGTAWRYVSERRQRERAYDLVGQYVPAPVARRLVDRHAGDLPEGRLTFLMTDIVGSTAAWEAYPDLMRAAVARHDELVEGAVEARNGAVVRPRGEGDSRFCVFLSPQDAAEAALDVCEALARERWATPQPIEIRAALTTGEADLRAGDYYGPDVNRCARIRSLARPNQVLTTEATAGGLRPPVGTADLGVHELKDIPRPERVFEVTRAG